MLQGSDAWLRAAGIGPSDGEGGGSAWLKRAFSMLDREDLRVDLSQLDSMAKVGLDGLTGLCCLGSAACGLPATCFMKPHLSGWLPNWMHGGLWFRCPHSAWEA